MFLLEKGANPFSNKTANITPLINSKPEVKELFEKFKKVYIFYKDKCMHDLDVKKR